MCGSPAEMDPLFGVVLADLVGQNLRFRERLTGPSFESASLCESVT